jgi:hypothetical protein
MKKLLITALLSLLSFSSQCGTIVIDPIFYIMSKIMGTSAIQGSGIPKRQHLPIKDITRVSFHVAGDLFIRQCKDPNNCIEQLLITADDNLLDILQASINGNSLDLTQKPNSTISIKTPIKYHLTLKNISNITESGSGNITSSPIITDTLTIQQSGSGNITAQEITTKKLEIQKSGSGNINAHINANIIEIDKVGWGDIILSGTSNQQIIDLSGSGTYNAKKLESDFVQFTKTGSGEIHLNAKEKIEGLLSGSGSGTYNEKHGPEVNVKTYGSARFKKASW